MRALVTADLHLTDRPVDEYRWKIFDWLRAQVEGRQITRVFILGDITHFKDGHSSKFVNRLVDELTRLASMCSVTLLKGNHDYIDTNTPFLKFIGKIPGIVWINEPMELKVDGYQVLFLPHTHEYIKAWRPFDFALPDVIFLHQAIYGAVINDHKIDGVPPSTFDETTGLVLAGDIHAHQKVGKVEYIGAPYPIAFGDNYETRVLLLENAGLGLKQTWLPIAAIKKVTAEIEHPEQLADYDLQEGDQVKIILKLPRSEFDQWGRYKQVLAEVCEEMRIHLYGCELREKTRERMRLEGEPVQQSATTPEDLLVKFGAAHSIDTDFIKAGLGFLESTNVRT